MKGKNLQPRRHYPARLSFRFDGETKSFPDKQKVKRIQHHQTSFTTNAKWTSLGRTHKRRKRSLQSKPKTIKKMVIESYISIITLTVNRLNASTKRHRLAGQMRTCVCMHFHLHITLINPWNCMYLFYIIRLIMFPLWPAIVIIFYFLSGYWLWKLINIFCYCEKK